MAVNSNKSKTIGNNKGAGMEEYLRIYFMQHGYYVLRGIKVVSNNVDITDIDLLLYNKSSVLSRERINVDIKNKKRSQVMERLFWTIGIQNIFGFDKCILATTDNRTNVRDIVKKTDVVILDGNFLQKLQNNPTILNESLNRISEDEFLLMLDLDGMGKFVGGWKKRIEDSKSRLINSPTFSSSLETLSEIQFFLEQFLTQPQNSHVALRAILYSTSIFLIQVDFLLKDLAFLNESQRYTSIKDGFKYGDNGLILIKQLLDVLQGPIEEKLNFSSKAISNWLDTELESSENEILAQFFSSNRNSGILFELGKNYLNIALQKVNIKHQDLSSNTLNVLYILLDYFGVERKKFFDAI